MDNNFWQNLKRPQVGLSPMDGVTDVACRSIMQQFGPPDILMTEFINVEGLGRGADKGLTAFLYQESTQPIIAQIYGVTPEYFYRSCFIALEMGFDGIDINMGCPSKSVANLGAGAGLIRTPKRAQEIIQACQKAVEDWSNGQIIDNIPLETGIITWTKQQQEQLSAAKKAKISQHLKIPISVKTRTGYDQPIIQEWLPYLLELRPANITIHGRTLRQMYSGQADWDQIRLAAELCQAAGISIFGNGDLQNRQQAEQKIQELNLNGALIGRSALGNPWLFRSHLPTTEERLQVALAHLRLHRQYFPNLYAPLKKHLGWYISNFPTAKELRVQLMLATTFETAEELILNYLNYNSFPPATIQ